jgi:hypothetical protein
VAALSVLEEHFGDAWGFALAAVTVTDLVEARTVEPSLLVVLHRMNADGLELQGRCLDLAGRYPDDLADELRARAQHSRGKASDLAAPWFKAGTGAVEAWSFLAMAEAGELATWTAVERVAREHGHAPLRRLASWSARIQRQHLDAALQGVQSVAVARVLDPAPS